MHVGDGKFYVRLVKDVLSFFCSFGMYVLFLSFQIMLSSNSWKGFQQFSAINVYKVLDVMLKSRADSTTKAYVSVLWTGLKVDISTCSYPFLLVLFLYICLKFSSLALLVPQ